MMKQKNVLTKWHTESVTAAKYFEDTITLKKKYVFE